MGRVTSITPVIILLLMIFNGFENISQIKEEHIQKNDRTIPFLNAFEHHISMAFLLNF